MRVFVLIEKWCDLNPTLGVTSGNANVIGSLEASGLAEVTTFFYDEFLAAHGQPIDAHFLAACRGLRPDLVVVNYYPFAGDPRNVRKETIGEVKSMGIPVVFTWFDFVHDHIRDLATSLLDVTTVSVVFDTVEEYPGFLYLWVPQDQRIFRNPGHPRHIDACFVGTEYQDRRYYLDQAATQVGIYRSGGQRQHNLSIHDYAGVLQRSKMSINFSAKGPLHQAKSRIFESMCCGALLLEHDTAPIRRWFQPFVHYVPFSSGPDLAAKIKHYCACEQERQEIASRGQREMEDRYSCRAWWAAVFREAGVA